LNFLLGELYAKAILAMRQPVELIGLHGQTIFHEGGSNTLQIGEAAVVAERTGIDVISNFREADIAAGGQGAPLVPFVDYLLFRHARKNRVALNIGGIANITVIPKGGKATEVVAFDTGPGNMVIDALVAHMTGGKQRFDRNGRIARSAKIHDGLVMLFSEHPYLKRWPPKTCGREQFGTEFVSDLLGTGLSLPDLIATATEFTAYAIVYQIFRTIEPDEVIVSGGGVHNGWLMQRLKSAFPENSVKTSAEFGIDPDAKEAIAFAVLAYESARGRPGNLPSATGARHPVVLGKRSHSSVSRSSAS
jgi:anhydro-N-acetylmuramic acid kinase